jgi:3-hydroxyacyl-CoA dehydrogenase/3-hydroxy-2-methylbutyryl-CoA dehydrogenase
MRHMDIDHTAALVAGGASGLGEATARLLHGLGARLTILDVDEARGSALASELGGEATFVRADVSCATDVQAAVARAARAPGGLRVAVCCAGIGWAERTAGKRGPHALEPFERLVAINLVGTFNVLRLASASMRDNEPDAAGGRGVCVTTASIAAFEGQSGQLAYAATKGAIASMTLPAARDLAPRGVRVCAIAPGSFDTPLLAQLPAAVRDALAREIPFPQRLGHPAEFAKLVGQIVDNEMLNGEVIRLDGALRLPA